ncbi:MAG: response regulator transcription factor [Cyclobacteriaceae bacterium]|jgi:DNA-binding LytR/AlgR family response regulator|nr:response regulator transcription factor [Cyclobacteriaceae bacterium]
MESTVKCVIVEDDPVSMEVMKGLVERAGFLKLQQAFNDPFKAVQWLADNTTDLLLLDIEMPGINGLELLKSITQKPCVIIISSKEEYAVQAFDFDVVAYLVKPIKAYSKFLNAVSKVKDKLKTQTSTDTPDRIFVKVDSLLIGIEFNRILWVEAFGDYVKINTAEKVFTTYNTMKTVEGKLPRNQFTRVHRSFIVNVSKIGNIDQGTLLIGKKIIPIGNSYREALMNQLNTL